MKLAVLDIGSNTAHMVIVERDAHGRFTQIDKQKELLQLADAAFPSMVLPDEAADRLVATVAGMRAFADDHGVATLIAFATSAIREAKNGMDVLARVRREAGVPVKVLPGSEEARLTYVAARAWATFSAKRLLVLDIGGGSLEVAGGEGDHPSIAVSLPLGGTRLTRRFFTTDPPRSEELAALRVHALAVLGPLAAQIREQEWDVVCATSKTFRTLGSAAEALDTVPSPSAAFGFAGSDGQTAPRLTAESVNLLAGHLEKTTLKERRKLDGVNKLRAANLIAGSQIAALAMQAFGLSRMVLAPWALREGLIVEHLQRLDAATRTTVSPRLATVMDYAQRYTYDEVHCRHVTTLALSLFDQTTQLHQLGAQDRELLEYAALLHDVGTAVAQSARHKHSLYIISNAELVGFSRRELLLIANVARYHRKALPGDHHKEYMALSERDRSTVRRLGALLRVADGLDLDHFQVVESVAVADDNSVVRLQLTARDQPQLSLWGTERNSDLFELEFGRQLQPEVGAIL